MTEPPSWFKPQTEDLSTDWLRSAGDFECTQCGRKRLTASEFSNAHVKKCLESLSKLDRDERSDVSRQLFVQAVCKNCQSSRLEEEEANRERNAAAAEVY